MRCLHQSAKARGITHTASILMIGLLLSGCKATITNRFEVQNDGSVVVHTVERIDDQLYSLASSQGSVDWGKPVDGWDVKKSVTDDGDHVVDASEHVPSLKDAGTAIANYYKAGVSSKSPASGVASAVDPSNWHFDLEERGGLFTKTYHVHADIPRLIPENFSSSADASSGEAFGAQMAAGILPSILSLRTEIKVPGKILSTNGEQLADGSIRFTHPLTAPSEIDLVDETADFLHIGLAVVLGLSLLALTISRRSKTLSTRIYAPTNNEVNA